MNVTGARYSMALLWLLTSSTFIVTEIYASESATSGTTGTTLPLVNDSTESAVITSTASSTAPRAATDGENADGNSVDLSAGETVTSEDGLIEVTISNNHKPPRGSIIVTNEVNKNVQELSSPSKKQPDPLATATDDTRTSDATTTISVAGEEITTASTASSPTENGSDVSASSSSSSSPASPSPSLFSSSSRPTSVTESSVPSATNNEVEGDPVTGSTETTTPIDSLIDDSKCFNNTKEWQLSLLRRIQVTQDNVKFQLDSTLGPEGASRRDLLRRALANLMTLQSRVSSRDPETSEEESQVGLLMSSEGRLNRIGWVVYRNRKDWEFNDCCYQGINFMCGSRNNTPFFDPR